MPKFKLSMARELWIAGEFIKDESKIFSLSENGDLSASSLVVDENPNASNPNLVLSIGVNGIKLYGTSEVGEEVEPPEPKPNLIDAEESYLLDGYSEIVEENSDYIIVDADNNGTGILFPVNLETNRNYIMYIDIEIIASTNGSSARVGAYNVSGGGSIDQYIISASSEIGVIQKLSGTFNSGADTLPSDTVEIEILCSSSGDGVVFKIYKDSMVLELLD